jgi:hypothetical protein
VRICRSVTDPEIVQVKDNSQGQVATPTESILGWKIGITGMKINLSSLLKVYTVKPVLYNTIKEIELDYAILMMPKDESQDLLEKGKKLVVNSSDSNKLGCTL